MSIEVLIESIGLSANDLRKYLLREVDEFLAADEQNQMREELGDVLFALMAMAWAHTGTHFTFDLPSISKKLADRIRSLGALSAFPIRFGNELIKDLKYGVIHLAFGNFSDCWTTVKALKNGTVAEIDLLTHAPFRSNDRYTNHCIVTFDNVREVHYDFVGNDTATSRGSIVLCRLPDFLFRYAKRKLLLGEASEYLSRQVMCAVDHVNLEENPVAHFHSWESGFLFEDPEFQRLMGGFRTLFSPYLTLGRLQKSVHLGHTGKRMFVDTEEIAIGSRFEQILGQSCDRLIVESSSDLDYFERIVGPEKVDGRSFAIQDSADFVPPLADPSRLRFLAGGRPSAEKGFVELVEEFKLVAGWAESVGCLATLEILCRELDIAKGHDYIAEIEKCVNNLRLAKQITIMNKVPMPLLKNRIRSSSALIVPSLFDPYCLMPTYAVEVCTPAFVSCHAGVSESVVSREYVFDPCKRGSLTAAIAAWHDAPTRFVFSSRFPSYRDLYLDTQ